MRKYQLLLIALLSLTISATAAVVEPERALRVAQSFMPMQSRVSNHARAYASSVCGEIVYSHPMPKSGRTAIYVVNISGGFVLVSADDIAHPVLGYNYGSSWPENSNVMPPQVKSYLDDLAAQMEAASGRAPDAETAAEWQQPRSTPRRATKDNLPDSVGPLLTTTWGQGQYYNSQCPADIQSVAGGHVPAGCVATAMAQVLKYWSSAMPGKGVHTYTCDYGTRRFDYEGVVFDYAQMPNALSSMSSEEEVNAVARLIYACGVAVNTRYMNHAYGESSADGRDIRAGLVNYFSYAPYAQYAERGKMRDREWLRIIKNNISSLRPILYGGTGTGSHLFVCDGYKSGDYFHFNFGWEGVCDGWFLLTAIEPDAQTNYNSDQTAILDIVPEANQNEPVIYTQYMNIYCSGSSFLVSNPIHLFNVMDNNEYAYVNYYPRQDQYTFIASDSTKQVVVYFPEYISTAIDIYDGEGTTNLLRRIKGDGGVYRYDNSAVVSSSHALTVRTKPEYLNSYLHIIVEEYDSCQMISNYTAYPYDTHSFLMHWDNREGYDHWQIEYGQKGFAHGEGTLVEVDTNYTIISGLQNGCDYEFYLRSVCDANHVSRWSTPAVMSVRCPIWTEIVTQKPDGFVEDANGNVTITSAEGLAWLSRISNNHYTAQPRDFAGKTITLANDINLGQYYWSPIQFFKGILDGNGYKIVGLKGTRYFFDIIGGGLFTKIESAIIKNVQIVDCDIDVSWSDASGLVSEAYNSKIYNCLVSGSIYSDDNSSTGIVNICSQSEIVNCCVFGKIGCRKGHQGVTGLLRNARNSKIYNCYTSVELDSKSPTYTYSICSETPNTELSNCYSSYYTQSGGFCKFVNEGMYSDIVKFVEDNNEWILLAEVPFENGTETNLLEALNKGIEKYNIPGLRYWIMDSTDIYQGLPVHSNREYVSTCPNVEGLSLRNVEIEGGDMAVEVLIASGADYESYEVRYGVLSSVADHTIDTFYVDTFYSAIDTLRGLEMGNTYIVQVRGACGTDHGYWSKEETIIFDLPYWTEVVTSRPEGYQEDNEGNIYISSAEGLAWLGSVVNGLNGENCDLLIGKTIYLEEDVNMSNYKWMALNSCQSFRFMGNNHTIKGLYINEQLDEVGMFGYANNATIRDLRFTNARIKGHELVGTICGRGEDISLFNCSVDGTVTAYSYSGGLVGWIENPRIDSCSLTGEVFVEFLEGGGIAGDLLDYINSGEYYVRNSFARCIMRGTSCIAPLVGGIVGVEVENCYANSLVDGVRFSSGLLGSTTEALIRNCYTSLYVDNPYGYQVEGGSPVALLAGHNYSIEAENIYYPIGNVIPLIAHNYEQDGWGQKSVTAIVGYECNSMQQALEEPIEVGVETCTTLINALNAWVDDNNIYGRYCHWKADAENINGGFPIFAYEEGRATTNISCDKHQAPAMYKVLRDGQILIMRGEQVFTITGQRISY